MLWIYYYYFWAHQHKAADRQTNWTSKVWLQRQFTLWPWCCGKKLHFLSYEKALEKECCISGIFRVSGDTPSNLLCELNGHLMPYTSCFYCYYYYFLYTVPRYGFPRWETKMNTRNLLWWSIIRAVFISKALVQQGSVETLYQNGNSLEQIADFTVVARYRGHLYSASSQGPQTRYVGRDGSMVT